MPMPLGLERRAEFRALYEELSGMPVSALMVGEVMWLADQMRECKFDVETLRLMVRSARQRLARG